MSAGQRLRQGTPTACRWERRACIRLASTQSAIGSGLVSCTRAGKTNFTPRPTLGYLLPHLVRTALGDVCLYKCSVVDAMYADVRWCASTKLCTLLFVFRLCAGVGYVLAFAFLMNYFAYLALKFYSGQQPRASVSTYLCTCLFT